MSQVRARLVITIMDDGRINLEGPIGDKLYCYGVLECAKDAIRRHCDEPKPERAPALQLPNQKQVEALT